MKITLLISQNCPACDRARSALSKMRLNGKKLTVSVTDIADAAVNVVPIVPALFINDKLFSYGDVDTEKLGDYISNL